MAHSLPPGVRLSFLCTLLAATYVTGTLMDNATEVVRGSNKSSELLTSLRRQLMADNYDYMSSESDEFPARLEAQRQSVMRVVTDAPAPPARPALPALLPFVNDIYIPRAAGQPPPGAGLRRAPDYAEDSAASPRGPDMNDLLYYIDDGRLSRRAGDDLEPLYTDDPAVDTTPKTNYKLLKIKVPGRSRRAGSGAYRRFLQEEGEGGVALINLGDEPFPEFRLPSARRQYMSDEAPRAGSDLDIVLPTDLDEEPAA